MDCPHCHATNTRLCSSKTILGYQQYRCRVCSRQYNERTGSALNFIEYPTAIVMMVVHYYYRFKLSLDDVVELMFMRDIHISHQTVHNWTQTFGVELGLKLRARRKGKAGKKWHIDATYLRVEGRWCYLYRAIDKAGDLVDVYLSDIRDQKAAESFFKQSITTTDVIPSQITTDKEAALYPAIENSFPAHTCHRDIKHMNNIIEADHRGIKSRYGVMKGFKNIFCALIFCTAFEEIRQFFRTSGKTRAERRSLISSRFQELYSF